MLQTIIIYERLEIIIVILCEKTTYTVILTLKNGLEKTKVKGPNKFSFLKCLNTLRNFEYISKKFTNFELEHRPN